MNKKQGWWEQIQSGDYAETKLSYGTDIFAVDPRLQSQMEKNLQNAS